MFVYPWMDGWANYCMHIIDYYSSFKGEENSNACYNMERPGNHVIKWCKLFVKRKIPLKKFLFFF